MNMDKIVALCKKYKVAKLWVFGSILTPRFNDESDVDLLVVFDRSRIALLEMADIFFDFIDELEALFGRKVDLTDYTAIHQSSQQPAPNLPFQRFFSIADGRFLPSYYISSMSYLFSPID